MAKKSGIENPEIENPEGLNPDSTEEKVPEARVNVTTSKKVKVRASEDIDCIVGGTSYAISKDKEATLPSDVAAILCFAGKAYRL